MKKIWWLVCIITGCLILTACAGASDAGKDEGSAGAAETKKSRYLSFLDDEPNTFDPQCTTSYYTIPLNIFDRLVEVETENGESRLIPSLAESWEISEDGLTYLFHLRSGVTFSNGEPLTAEDVQFTLERLLNNPDSENADLALSILGAEEFRSGTAEELEGFQVIDPLTFEITLAYPYAPFLAGLSTPGASILDETSTVAARRDFGKALDETVGTGPFILEEWTAGMEIRMKANPDYWGGAPGCDGLRMMFLSNTVSPGSLYEEGQLDILDLEYLGNEGEYFVHGDIYRKNLARGPRVGITYIALNESVAPLNDVRVRKALQLALDRETLMKAVVSGRGTVENGIFPQGLFGHNKELEAIPYDLQTAAGLLSQAGLGGGFDLSIYCTEGTSDTDMDQLQIIASMWEKIGVRSRIVSLSSDEFMNLRKQGGISCYVSTWSADFNDPDNFIYTFFGSRENTVSRSLCYDNEEVIGRVAAARSIVDEQARVAEYQDLERKIIQEDAAWIPLYSKLHLFVVNDRVDGFRVSWNGWSSNRYYTTIIK